MNCMLVYKFGVIVLFILLLLIFLLMIDGLICDCQEVCDGVLQDIVCSFSYSQCFIGLLLVVLYCRMVCEWVIEEKIEKCVLQECEQCGELYFLFDCFVFDGQMCIELCYCGIYQVCLYYVDNKVVGYFQVFVYYGIEEDLEDYQFEMLFLVMGISDICGIENVLCLFFNGVSVDFELGSWVGLFGSGVYVLL